MRDPAYAVRAASLCAAAMIAYQVAGKATRDALFLGSFPITSLPTMVVVSAVICILVAVAGARAMARIGPARTVGLAFATSAALLVVEWLLYRRYPKPVAVALYLHVAIFGLFTVSAFWSLLNERFDPRTAKRAFGRIAAAGALGGFIGGLLAERVATMGGMGSMLLLLAILNLFCASMAMLLRGKRTRTVAVPGGEAETVPHGIHLVLADRYLRNLALFVILGTVTTTLVDYVFKAQAAQVLGHPEKLLRFFALFYTATGLLSYLAQILFTRVSLEGQGVARTSGALPLTVAATGLGFIAFPGLAASTIFRGSESVVRNSFFRSGYELLYTPVPSGERRAAKPIIDVGAERVGDALGGGIAKAVVAGSGSIASFLLAGTAVALSLAGVFVARRLHVGYVGALERNLVNRASTLRTSARDDEATDLLSQTIMLPALGHAGGDESMSVIPIPRDLLAGAKRGDEEGDHRPEVERLLALLSNDPGRIRRALDGEALPAACIAPAIALLARDELAREVIRALRRAMPRITGQLVDALLDPERDVAVRRRVPRILAASGDSRAVEGLVAGLEDWRFEVRFQCARSLVRMRENIPGIVIDAPRIQAAVLREAAAGRAAWESEGPLARRGSKDRAQGDAQLLRDRAGRSMEHVFTLLSLILPRRPLQISLRGLYSDDPTLRGTALEYLESVLPREIRDSLWPYLEDTRSARPAARPREEVLEDLMKANPSMEINLKELRKQVAFPDSEEGEP